MTAPRTSPAVTLSVLATAGIAFALLQSLVAPALPEIQQATGASETAVSWILTSYLLSASIATPIMGRLGDAFGKERMLMLALAGLAVGTLMSALAPDIGWLLAGRVVQGVGGGIFPIAFAIIRDEFPRDRVPGSIGLMSSLFGIGGGLGVVLAGVIVDGLNYHFLFWLPLIPIVLTMVATHFYVPESPIKTPGSINWAGAVLMSAGLSAVLLAVSQATNWGWGSSRTLGLLAVGLVILAAWVRSELRSRGPLVDMQMMRIRGVWTTNVVAVLIGVGMYSSFILIPTLVQEPASTGYGFGSSVTGAGLFLLPSTIAMLLVGQFTGRLERRFGSKPPLVAGIVFCATAFLLLGLARAEHWEVYVASTLLGLGIGLSFAAMANLIVENVRQDQTGVATGMNTVMRTLGGAFGAQVAGTLLAGQLAAGRPTAGAFTLAFTVCAVALLAGIGVAALIPGRRRTPPRAPALREPVLAGSR